MRGCHELDVTVSPSSFLTLTYAPEFLPENASLCRADIVNFLRRLRRRVFPLRHLTVGEYGDRTARPHYHSIVFGWQPDDLVPIPSRDDLFSSAFLAELWGKGLVSVGVSVTSETISYLTSYIIPRQDLDNRIYYSDGIDLDTGELQERIPQFLIPCRPGLGRLWWERNKAEVLRTDGMVRCSAFPGPIPVPAFYVSLLDDLEREQLRALTGADHDPVLVKMRAITSASKKIVQRPLKDF